MSRQATIQRLPVPPPVQGTLQSAGSDVKALQEHIGTMTTVLNQAIQSLQNRVNTVQQTGATQPPNVTGLTVAGKQGLFSMTWNRIQNADGYVVVQASDSKMTQITGRYNISDGQQCTHQIPVGNTAVTGHFQVYAYQGQKYSDPSPAVTATSATFTTSESAPPTPPIAPQAPKVAPVRSGPNL